MMKANLLQSFFKKNNTRSFPLTGLLVRIFLYGGIFVNLPLLFYNFERDYSGLWNDIETVQDLGSPDYNLLGMNLAQLRYYNRHGKFAASMQKLKIKIEPETHNYSYRILSPMVPTQTLNQSGESAPEFERVVMVAQAKSPMYASFIGAVYAFKDKKSNEFLTKQAACQVLPFTPLPSTMPTLSGSGIQCPKGSHLFFEPLSQVD